MTKIFTLREPEKEELESMFEQRWRVMRKPFDLPKGSERSDEDKTAQLVIAIDEETRNIAGSARLNYLKNGAAFIAVPDCLAVLEEFRGYGLGRMLVDYRLQKARENGAEKSIICARRSVVGFHKKFGYQTSGDYFKMLPTNVEHIKMEFVL